MSRNQYMYGVSTNMSTKFHDSMWKKMKSIERSLKVKLPTLQTDRVREEKRRREKIREEKDRRKKMQVRE